MIAATTAFACSLWLFQDGLPNGVAQNGFSTSVAVQGSHGGEPIAVQLADNTVYVTINKRWFGAEWQRADGKVIAQVILARAQDTRASQVLQLSNPDNLENYISVACEPK